MRCLELFIEYLPVSNMEPGPGNRASAKPARSVPSWNGSYDLVGESSVVRRVGLWTSSRVDTHFY